MVSTSIASGRRLLATLQLADSFFPAGAYAHSQGLETMVAQGWISSSDEVGEYLADLLMGAVLPADGVALLSAHRSASSGDVEAVIEIDRLLHAMKLPEEMRLASTRSGRRYLDESLSLMPTNEVPAVFGHFRAAVVQRETPGSAAVAFAVSAWAAGVDAETALFAFCHSFAVGILGGAQRLLPMSHAEAQRILRSLHGQISTAYLEIQGRQWQEMTSFTPLADIASMLHETAEVRMFAS